jgi:hypothetical protein
MIRTLLLALFLVFSGIGILCAQTAVLLKPELTGLISGEVSGKVAFENIRDLSVFPRWYGSDGMEGAARWIMQRAERYGLSGIRLEEFPVDKDTYYFMQKPWLAWNCRAGELRMVEPVHELITSYDANSPCILVNSRDTDLQAEVVYVGAGTSEKDYAGKEIKGKIVLASGNPWDVSKLAVFEMGAAGILTAMSLDVPGASSTEVYETRICPWTRDQTRQSTFGFFLSTDQGKAILRRLQGGERVVVHADVEAELRVPGRHFGVTAVIPGSEYPDEEIIFTAHLDHPRPGAHDNNSGCGVLLEVARTIHSLVARGLLAAPKRTLRFYWTPHVWGVDMFYSHHPELLSKTVANINIDCVGLNQTKFSSAFTVVKTPFSRASFLDDILVNLLEYLSLSNNNSMGRLPAGPMMTDHDGSRNVLYGRVVPYLDYSDHIFFNSGDVGIPAVLLIDLPFGSHHSQNDELGLLDPTQLKRVSFLAAAASYIIASAGPSEAPAIADELDFRGQERIRRELRMAKDVLRKAGREDLPGRFRAAKNILAAGFKREIQALGSTQLFIKGDAAAESDLTGIMERWRSEEKFLMAEIESLFDRRRVELGTASGEPALSDVEKQLKGIVPRKNPALKGAFGILNVFPDDRYAFEKYSPLHAYLYELVNFMDGRRDIMEILATVDAEAATANYPTFSRAEVLEFLLLLKKEGVVFF